MLTGWRLLLARPVTMADLLRKGPFSGQGFHLRTSVCAFHFLPRGSKLSKLVKCQGPSDGQERVSALVLDPNPSSSQPALAPWHLTLPGAEKDDNENYLVGCWGRAECDNAAINTPGPQCL